MVYIRNTFLGGLLVCIVFLAVLWMARQKTTSVHAATAQITGELTSSVFDTGATSTLNTIMWQGTLPSGTTVKFQIASSNCLNGATNAPTCNSGSWSYLGSDGSISTYYTPSAPNVQVPLRQSDHSKRYFRYKIYLVTDSVGVLGPTVNDVIVSWSR